MKEQQRDTERIHIVSTNMLSTFALSDDLKQHGVLEDWCGRDGRNGESESEKGQYQNQ